jgi:hypothetical protein
MRALSIHQIAIHQIAIQKIAIRKFEHRGARVCLSAVRSGN